MWSGASQRLSVPRLQGPLPVLAVLVLASLLPSNSAEEDCGSGGKGGGGFLAPSGGKGDLEPDKFAPCIKDGTSHWLVEYHSHQCGTCQAFQPTWNELARELEHRGPKGLRVARIGIDEKAGLQIAEKEDALKDGVPCLFIYLGGGHAPQHVFVAEDRDDGTFPAASELRQLVAAKYLEALQAAGGTVPEDVSSAANGKESPPSDGAAADDTAVPEFEEPTDSPETIAPEELDALDAERASMDLDAEMFEPSGHVVHIAMVIVGVLTGILVLAQTPYPRRVVSWILGLAKPEREV